MGDKVVIFLFYFIFLPNKQNNIFEQNSEKKFIEFFFLDRNLILLQILIDK